MSNPTYPVTRRPVYAQRGMVASSQPLAVQAGLQILQVGGNAIDAAIATAATLTVVEPTSNGIGGDAFALVYSGGQLHGLNASGGAPKSLSLELLELQHAGRMPKFGWTPVTVPGAVRGWIDLHERFGQLDFAEVLAPAIEYAQRGFPLSPMLAHAWQISAQHYHKLHQQSDLFTEWVNTFAPNGFHPQPGAIWRSEAHARTLQAIAKTRGEAFYTGDLAAQIDAHSRKTGGQLRLSDLEAHRSEWVEPIWTEYAGHRVYEIPPNGQGIAALVALNVLSELPPIRDDAAGIHAQIEAMKRGFYDAHTQVADPHFAEVDVTKMLSEQNTAQHRQYLSELAHDPQTQAPSTGGTVYLATADDQGHMVSMIQSNYMGFGSGVVVPNTGIALHNRGHNFNLEAAHPNALKPRKRPYHTIIPGFLGQADSTPIGPFGVMGGFMQPQGHLQVMINTLKYGMNPQQALDAPRWQWLTGRQIEVEQRMSPDVIAGLIERGHELSIQPQASSFGRGQIIWRQPTGVLEGGTESRTDGHIAAW